MFQRLFGGGSPARPEISVDEAHTQLSGTDAPVLIDVREQHEYRAGHIHAAKLIPLGLLTTRLGEIPQDRPVILVCRSGNRSSVATDLLLRAGYTRVANMRGGMLAWQQRGYPVK